MKPYPFASLNHLTVPCAIRLFPLSLRTGMSRPCNPQATMAGGPPGSGGIKKAPSRTGVLGRHNLLHSALYHVRTKRHFHVTQSGEQISKGPQRLSRLFWGSGGLRSTPPKAATLPSPVDLRADMWRI